MNILLAEDERSVAFSIAFALKCDGHRIQIVADGGQALASIAAEPDRFDLLITDHSMPGMIGVELVQRLREESFRGKVMVLSAHYRQRTAPPTRRSPWTRWCRSLSTFTNCAPQSRGLRTG